MSSQGATIEIPTSDIWTLLFDRKDKPFPDDQIIYLCPNTGRHYTWAALKTATERFGSSLNRQWKWEKGDVLAVFSQNCIDTPVITWGCHLVGGIVSPINPASTVEELTHYLKDSKAKALFTQKILMSTALKAASNAGIPIERIMFIGEEKDETRRLKHFADFLHSGNLVERTHINVHEDVAFLAYSSGTTGLPKGVMLSHHNIVSNLAMSASAEGKLLSWDQDKILSVLPYYHIYGLQILVHIPVYLGIRSIVMPSFDLKTCCAIIQDYKITRIYVAPPIVLHLAKSPIISEYDLSSLKSIVCAAAPLSKDLIHAVYKRLGTGVRQAYGLSETSPATHIQTRWDNGIGSVGPALPNQIVKIVSPQGKGVAHGASGEIWISGPNVFLGYHNNPAATALSKTPDGFFKTGDIGYEDEQGNLFITDRVKELIKYKGFQVAPAEVEGMLTNHELVKDAAVIGVMDESIASEVPMAFIVPDNDSSRHKETKDAVNSWLDDRVASHKRLRGGIRWIDEIPKSASGKILRRVLKDLLVEEERVKAKL